MDQVTFDVYMYMYGLGNLGLNSLSIERVAGNTAFFFFYQKLSLIQASPANPPLHGLTRKVLNYLHVFPNPVKVVLVEKKLGGSTFC